MLWAAGVIFVSAVAPPPCPGLGLHCGLLAQNMDNSMRIPRKTLFELVHSRTCGERRAHIALIDLLTAQFSIDRDPFEDALCDGILASMASLRLEHIPSLFARSWALRYHAPAV